MGKGGGGGGPSVTESTVTQTDLPEYVKPYFERLLTRTEAESKADYTPYTGTRLIDPSEETEASRAKIEEIVGAGQPLGQEAQGYIQDAIARFQQGQDFALDPLTAAGSFTTADAQAYMDPYLETVLQRQREGAIKEFERGQAARDATAVEAGAFGGSRQAVQQYLAEEGLADRIADIEASGMQTAYGEGRKAFEADRQARLQVETSQAELDQAAEKLGMSAAEAATMSSNQLAQLEQQAIAGNVDAAKLLEAVGRDKEARSQLSADLAYQDFLRQRDYDREQLQFFSSVLRGVPVSPSQEQAKTTPVNPYQQLLGTGITGLSLYKALS